MKKRLLAITFALVMAIGCLFGLAACKDDPKDSAPPTSISGEWDCWELRKRGDDQKWRGELEFTATFSNGNATIDGESSPYTIENGKLKIGDFEMEWKNGQWEMIDEYEEMGEHMSDAYILVEKGKKPAGYNFEEIR